MFSRFVACYIAADCLMHPLDTLILAFAFVGIGAVIAGLTLLIKKYV